MIRSKDTNAEVILRKALWENGIRYRKHYSLLPGNPDLAFPRKKIAVFIDGDFWHGYNWKSLGKIPPKAYWQEKISKNIRRDKANTLLLRKDGWKVIRIWEHELNKDFDKCIRMIEEEFRDGN